MTFSAAAYIAAGDAASVLKGLETKVDELNDTFSKSVSGVEKKLAQVFYALSEVLTYLPNAIDQRAFLLNYGIAFDDLYWGIFLGSECSPVQKSRNDFSSGFFMKPDKERYKHSFSLALKSLYKIINDYNNLITQLENEHEGLIKQIQQKNYEYLVQRDSFANFATDRILVSAADRELDKDRYSPFKAANYPQSIMRIYLEKEHEMIFKTKSFSESVYKMFQQLPIN